MMRLFLAIFSLLFGMVEAKTVLVLGGSGGIGSACVESFVEKGWRVLATKRKGSSYLFPEGVQAFDLDVTQEKKVYAFIEELEGIDVCVNCIGSGLLGFDLSFTLDEMKNLFDVHYFSVCTLLKALIPKMEARGGGHFIQVSSASGVRAIPGMGIHAASKFAIEGLFESLTHFLKPKNIYLSLVEPGSVKNHWSERALLPQNDCEYLPHFGEKLRAVIAQLASEGQPPQEIGDLMVEIAETPVPKLRYQTSRTVQAALGVKIHDLDGSIMEEKMGAVFDALR